MPFPARSRFLSVLTVLGLFALLSGFTFPKAAVTLEPDGSETFAHGSALLQLEQVPGWRTVPQAWVQAALEGHSYPRAINALLGEDYPIYITDRQIRFHGQHAAAVTGSSRFILLGARPALDRAEVERTVLHELGHALFLQTVTPERWEKYLRLRKLDESFRVGGTWQKEPLELFADDFAYLFGSGTATRPLWRFDVAEPQQVPGLRAFFLSLLLPEDAPEQDWLSLTFMEADQPLQRAEWVYALGELVPGERHRFRLLRDQFAIPRWAQYHAATFAAAGLIDTPGWRFEPTRPVSAAEAAADLTRLLGVDAVSHGFVASSKQSLTKGDALAILQRVQAFLTK